MAHVSVSAQTGYENLYRLTGLKRLDTNSRLSGCNLKSVPLEAVTAYFDSFEEEAAALENPSAIRALTVKGSIEQLDGIEIFSNVETLSLSAAELEDVDALAARGILFSFVSVAIKRVDG